MIPILDSEEEAIDDAAAEENDETNDVDSCRLDSNESSNVNPLLKSVQVKTSDAATESDVSPFLLDPSTKPRQLNHSRANQLARKGGEIVTIKLRHGER